MTCIFRRTLNWVAIIGTGAIVSSCTAAEPSTMKFPLMAWDYAEDLPTLEAMRDCGITSVAFVPIKALDACTTTGLQAIVYDERLSGDDYGAAFNGDLAVKNLPQVLQEVGDHPAALGYHLRDEPGPDQFAELGKAIAAVRELAPGKWPYVNLLPGDGESFDKYIDDFVKIAKPTALSYDRYTTLVKDEFQPVFWANLAQMREAALEHNLPFWNIILTATHWHYRDLTEADYRMQIFGSLVYGVDGIAFYKFRSRSLPILKAPDLGNFRNAPLDQFGEKTEAWHWLRNINRQVHNLAPILTQLRSDNVYHIGGEVPDRNHGAIESSLVKNIPDGEFIIGDFTHETSGKRYVMIVNRNMIHSQRCAPEFRSPPAAVNYISPVTGIVQPYVAWAYYLAPGQGVLLELN